MENSSPDLSKIIGLIMENPKLIEEISALAKKSDIKADESVVADEVEATESFSPKQEESEPTYTPASNTLGREKRSHLLGALKPYISKERGRAIDSMISIADMLDMMRSR